MDAKRLLVMLNHNANVIETDQRHNVGRVCRWNRTAGQIIYCHQLFGLGD